MAEPLIGSRTRGFRLRGRYPSLTRRSSTANTLPIPLDIQLAFNRKEIPGRTYKGIVDQVLQTVSPNTYAYNQLLKEQSQAISRIKDEEERAINEGRKLRRLQAQAIAAGTSGKTYEDAVRLYEFWYSEAEKASLEGDLDYSYQALINAGNARDQAERKAEAAANKAKSITGASATNYINELQRTKTEFYSYVRDKEKLYQRGIINGVERDNEFIKASSLYANFLNEKIIDLTTLRDAGIEKIGGNDIDNLITQADELLNQSVTIPNVGKVEGGLLGIVEQTSGRISGQTNYIDLIDPSTGGFQTVRTLRQSLGPTDIILTDGYGRSLKLTKTDTADGKIIYYGDFPNPNGKGFTRVQSQELEEGEEPVFSVNGRQLRELSPLGSNFAGRYNVYEEDTQPEFLRNYAKLDDSGIQDYINRLSAETPKASEPFDRKILNTVDYFNRLRDRINAPKLLNRAQDILTQKTEQVREEAPAIVRNVAEKAFPLQTKVALTAPKVYKAAEDIINKVSNTGPKLPSGFRAGQAIVNATKNAAPIFQLPGLLKKGYDYARNFLGKLF